MKAKWREPEYHKQHLKALRKAWRSDNYRKQQSQNTTEAHVRGDFNGVYQSPTTPELAIMAILGEMNIKYEFNTFTLGSYTYDFYLPQHAALIEYDGAYWHSLAKAKRNDAIKDQLALQNALMLIRISPPLGHDFNHGKLKGILEDALSTKRSCRPAQGGAVCILQLGGPP